MDDPRDQEFDDMIRRAQQSLQKQEMGRREVHPGGDPVMQPLRILFIKHVVEGHELGLKERYSDLI